ncbi:uncharacterized protein LOC141761203 [Sebastes fasciatus]|uniref:uncharacterized protein LOC141761203 n=1 Tax=Sebastes fasciatus TaxID=394691 RepID=UPI003D9E663A
MSGSQYIWILNGTVLQNVAMYKKTFQSSQSSVSGAAGVAVDGNKDLRIEKGSCIVTSEESDPWWRVDLANVYNINAVTITNTNIQENRLNGAEIWIGNSVKTNDTKNIRCAVISHIPAGRTFYFPCSGAEGRYVTVLLPGSKKILSVCEVEVFPTSPNVALKGIATQSSTRYSFVAASRAIDGRQNSFYHDGSCTHSATEANPWWRVDLRRTHIVSSVKVTNRGDCCAERLNGAEIRIGNSLENNGNDNSRCATISNIRAGKTNTYHCDGGSMEGRFVNVIIPGKDKILTLCEVEVYAVEPLVDVAFKKPAQQSFSFYSNGVASNAVSGCKSGDFLEGCCSQTDLWYNPWWRVDLLAVYKVSAISITGRRDCCATMLTDAQIRIGNLRTEYDFKNPKCGVISPPVGPSAHTFDCAGMEGRYVKVIIPRYSNVVLCGVEVFASLADHRLCIEYYRNES